MVYLIHFYGKISPNRGCCHYWGYAAVVRNRLIEHLAGRGARLTQVAIERNIPFWVARVWEGGRALERKMKNRKNSADLCPICRARRNGGSSPLYITDGEKYYQISTAKGKYRVKVNYV